MDKVSVQTVPVYGYCQRRDNSREENLLKSQVKVASFFPSRTPNTSSKDSIISHIIIVIVLKPRGRRWRILYSPSWRRSVRCCWQFRSWCCWRRRHRCSGWWWQRCGQIFKYCDQRHGGGAGLVVSVKSTILTRKRSICTATIRSDDPWRRLGRMW